MRLGLVLLLVAVTAPAFAQVAAPPRDTTSAVAPAVGARISGRVLAADGRRPLYRALVQLLTGNLQPSRWTWTDLEGRWAFSDVAAGSYTVIASRDGFVSMGYGQQSAHGTPAPVVIADRRSADGLEIALLRGGVVNGRITDDLGEPIGGVAVRAQRVRFVDGQLNLGGEIPSLLSILSGGVTNDRGEYRLFGLAPGTYYLSASMQAGRGRLDDRTTYATTYAPGTALIAAATPVTVSLDRESAADFSLVRTSLAVVTGTLTDPSGAPSFGDIRLVPIAPGHAVGASVGLGARSESGVFTVRGVPPGNYYLRATAAGSTSAPPTLAVMPLTVSGEDVRDVFVQTAPAPSLRGVLKADSQDARASADGFYVGARPLDSAAASVRGDFIGSRTDVSGAFVVPGLFGRHLIRLQNISPKPGWWLKSVLIDGVDVTDTGYNFQSGRDVSAEVIVSQRMAAVTGAVQDTSGRQVTDYTVVAFADEDTKWGPSTRFIGSGGPRSDGSFRIEGLPAGNYVVIAVAPLEAGEETDPNRLKNWRGLGQAISLGEAETRTVALRLAR